MLSLLESLCMIDTRSRENPSGTVQAAKIAAKELEPLGFKCEFVAPEEKEVTDIRHLIATKNPDAKRKIILLGHLDTVLSPVEVPFSIDDRKGRVYGSGVSDMKGGIVIMIEALKLFLKEPRELNDVSLTVILNSSEESPISSFPKLERKLCAGANAILNFEPGFLGESGEHIIVKCRKGIVRYLLTCEGRAAHSGNHHQAGANAIREIARKVEAIEALTDYNRGISANVGRIKGGKVYNQVADFAEIEFELRSVNPSLLQEMEMKIETICKEITVRSDDGKSTCKTKLLKRSGYPPFPENKGTEKLVKLYQSVAEKHKVTVKTIIRGGASDCNCIADLAPAIDGLGILGGDFHNKEEWADLNSISLRIQPAAEFMTELVDSNKS